jgi:hypothetical protein
VRAGVRIHPQRHDHPAPAEAADAMERMVPPQSGGRVMDAERAAAVERLTELLERDVVTVDEFNALVARALAATSAGELELVLDDVPVVAARPLVISCISGVVKETPTTLPEAIEIRCESGVLKVDLSKGEIESDITDLDIEVLTGVVKIILPKEAIVELEEHVAAGGVFSNKVRAVKAEPWRPRILVHVRNEGAVLKLTRARR